MRTSDLVFVSGWVSRQSRLLLLTARVTALVASLLLLGFYASATSRAGTL